MNENENTTQQNLGDTVKAALRGKLIAVDADIKKEISQISSLTVHSKELEIEETKHNNSKRTKVIKIRAETTNKREQKNQLKNQKARSCFFEKIKKIGKPQSD